MIRTVICSHCVAGFAVLLLAGSAEAAVEYLSQEQRVFALANQVGDEDSSTSTSSGTLRAEADGSTAEFRSTALVTQDANLGDGGFLYTGRLEFEVTTLMPPTSTAGVGARAGFVDTLRFALSEPYDFRFVEERDVEEISGSQGGEQGYNLVGPEGEVFNTNSGPKEGRLEAGEYRFSYGNDVSNAVQLGAENGVFRGTYEVGIVLTPVDDNGGGSPGPTPNPIPLPPAAWPGVLTMAGVGMAMWLRRRRGPYSSSFSSISVRPVRRTTASSEIFDTM